MSHTDWDQFNNFETFTYYVNTKRVIQPEIDCNNDH